MWILTNPLFNKETKQSYSWIPKGWTSAVINQTVSGSISMISAFLSNSEFLCSLYHSTVDSFVFCDFVKLLKYSLTKLNIDIKTQVVVVLDNASYHRSAQTIEWFKYHGISVEFCHPIDQIWLLMRLYSSLLRVELKNCELESLWILANQLE